jgi:hypothetical protein
MTGVAVAAPEIVNPEEASIQVEKDELPLASEIVELARQSSEVAIPSALHRRTR